MSEMTGLERLRALGREQEERSWSTVGKVRGRLMLQIAEQIEDERFREQLAVERVASEMELHCLGVEGMDDSPVARWARELRETLGRQCRDISCDMSHMTDEDREAVAWVREHGGLDYVREEWRSRVPYYKHEKTRQRLLDHIAECETALGRRNERIEELGKTIEFYQLNNSNFRHLIADVAERLGFTRFGNDYEPCDLIDSLDRRLMPEGCEWPRYESGELVEVGDGISVTVHDEDGDFERTMAADSVSFDGQGVIVSDPRHVVRLLSGERVRRPEPPDSWERIELDAKKETCAYFGVEGGGYGCSECPVKQWEESCDEVKSSDLVRRCRALAERERGE